MHRNYRARPSPSTLSLEEPRQGSGSQQVDFNTIDQYFIGTINGCNARVAKIQSAAV